jgi:hypothetical protein
MRKEYKSCVWVHSMLVCCMGECEWWMDDDFSDRWCQHHSAVY